MRKEECIFALFKAVVHTAKDTVAMRTTLAKVAACEAGLTAPSLGK